MSDIVLLVNVHCDDGRRSDQFPISARVSLCLTLFDHRDPCRYTAVDTRSYSKAFKCIYYLLDYSE